MSKKKKKGARGGPFEALRGLKDELAKAEEKAPAKKPPAPRPAKAAGGEDDALLLHRLYAGVEPLDRSRERVSVQPIERTAAGRDAAARAAERASAEADAVREHLRTLIEGQARFEVTDDGARVEGRRLDLPVDALRRLRRGLLPIDARLDLHGLGAKEARTSLDAFLKATRARGERCVLVIHGKGQHSPGGAGVLRGEIGAWLSQGAVSQCVAAFATARADDGGEGAVYVLLRRP